MRKQDSTIPAIEQEVGRPLILLGASIALAFNHCVTTSMRLLQYGLALMLAFVVQPTTADVVELRGGGQVEGSVKRIEQERAPYAVVQVDSNLRVAIPESQIARVAESADLAEYRQRAKAAAEDAEAHYELGRWCKGKQLAAQSRHHYQRAIAIDPEHSKARAALDYVVHDQRWIRNSELRKIRGMISVAGRDRLPEEVALVEARDETNVDVKLWIREIARLRAAVLRGGEKGNEAIAKLAAIDNPLAAPAIAGELLDAPRQPQSLRLLWIDRLGLFANRPALEALVRTGLSDPDSVVRERALETLQRISPSTAIANYVPMLKSNDNATVRRAASALSYFPDPELALALVDALVTEHKREIPADQRTSVGFGDGGSGMTTGGKAQIIVERVENPPVHSLLRQIEPEVDYGFNELRWRQHFAKRLSHYSGNLRSDP